MPDRPHYTNPVDRIVRSDCETLLKLALAEDAPGGDVTSDSIFASEERGRARVVAREPGVLCGLQAVRFLLEIDGESCGHSLELRTSLKDGTPFDRGDILLDISGSLPTLLRLERPMLNLLQYLSGISTTTAAAVKRAGPDIAILDTRKTLPGYRRLVKNAVYCGGGTNHRISLSDMAMVKDNHIAAAGSIAATLGRIAERAPAVPVELEVDTPEQLEELLAWRPLPRVVLLDNMNRDQLERSIQRLQALPEGERPFVEVSGGLGPEDLSGLSGLGRIGVSMGYLTHTTRFLDLGLDYTE